MSPTHSELAWDPSSRMAWDLPTLLRCGLSSTHPPTPPFTLPFYPRRPPPFQAPNPIPPVQRSTTPRHHGSSPYSTRFKMRDNGDFSRPGPSYSFPEIKYGLFLQTLLKFLLMYLSAFVFLFEFVIVFDWIICFSDTSWHLNVRPRVGRKLICI